MPLLAAGPVPAAESGVRQANSRPRTDDQPERTELREREREDLGRGENERPHASERRGLGVHDAECNESRA